MKNNFSYKDVYVEEGKRVLEINILPEKYCNFDCVFCPIGRSKNKIDVPTEFEDYDVALAESVEKLKDVIKRINPDKIEIVRIDDERMKKTMWVDDERFEEIKKELLNVK